MNRRDIKNRIASAFGLPTGEKEAVEYWNAFCLLFGRNDISVREWTPIGGHISRIYVNGPGKTTLGFWHTTHESESVNLEVEGVDSEAFRLLCRRLFWSIDGHRSHHNLMAAEQLSHLTPDLANR